MAKSSLNVAPAEIRNMISLPVVAIGSINVNNVAKVKAAGADSVAVISAILKSDDIEEATRQIVNEFGYE